MTEELAARALEEELVGLLLEKHLTISTAESCTGGMVASRLVNVPGVSECFREGIVTYSNKAKRKYLDVAKSTLKKYGAVSKETAKEMARGGMFAADSDICVAVTGIAGPDGGTDDKPVGLVYIGCSTADKTSTSRYLFAGDRFAVRAQAAEKALEMALEAAKSLKAKKD